jgi:predicted amidophosphoribosyltransferase
VSPAPDFARHLAELEERAPVTEILPALAETENEASAGPVREDCPRCGATLSVGWQFCPRCGTPATVSRWAQRASARRRRSGRSEPE